MPVKSPVISYGGSVMPVKSPVIGPKMRKFPVFTGNSPGQRTARDAALIRLRLLPGLVPGTRCQTGMGPEYPPGYRRLDRNSLFRDKCGGWLAVGAVCRERVCIDFPVNVRVQRCKFTHPDTFRSPETSASNSAWSLNVTTCNAIKGPCSRGRRPHIYKECARQHRGSE